MMKPVEHSVHSFEQLWQTPPTLSINESKDLVSEITAYDWRVYSSLHASGVEGLAERFMKYHAQTPGILLSKLAVSVPMAIGQYKSNDRTHKLALYDNGLTWQARRDNSTIAYTVLAVDEQTASRWSYPDNYLDVKALLKTLLSNQRNDQ